MRRLQSKQDVLLVVLVVRQQQEGQRPEGWQGLYLPASEGDELRVDRLHKCFYSFNALDTVDASGNTADAGWGWMPDQAINATKLWLRSNRASQQEQSVE